LYYNNRYDVYALSRFVDVQAAHSDPTTFISGQGPVLGLMGSELTAAGMIIFLDP
jgi:hypothetical protein